MYAVDVGDPGLHSWSEPLKSETKNCWSESNQSSLHPRSGFWGHLHRAEEGDQSGARVRRQDLHLHFHPGDDAQVARLWLQKVLHQLLVLAGLPHRWCKLLIYLFIRLSASHSL